MRTNTLNATLKNAVLAVAILLLGVGVAAAQVNLTAGAQTVTLSDGTAVPMWGYTCTSATAPNSCSALNTNAGGGWSPVLITAPSGSTLTINLTNNLPGTIPTSLTIVGQLGGGLGSSATYDPASDFLHPDQGVTWPIAGGTNADEPVFKAPPQADRVRSFATEVAHGATQSLVWQSLRPGTYLIETGTHPSIQGAMGLYGMLVVTSAPSGATPGTAYPGVNYNAEVPLLLSEIDPAQNSAVALAVGTAGFSPTKKWDGQTGQCGDPQVHTCYPPAVNYSPRYYLINGSSFDRSNTGHSLFPTSPAAVSGTILVRFVNAGLSTHVPSIVGAQTGSPAVQGFSLIAEDGNVVPDVATAVANSKPLNARVQNEVLMVAGKTYDVLINAPASGPALPVFDRQLSLSTNNHRDGGMQGYISANGAGVPASLGVSPQAVNDSYVLVPNGGTGIANTLVVSSPAKGVIANDVGVYGVQVLSGPSGGTLDLKPDGTFTYVPNSGTTSDSFTYQGNGNPGLTATVTLGACASGCLGSAPTANSDAYTSNIAAAFHVSPPGVLGNDVDPDHHPMRAVLDSVASGISVTLHDDGSFTATPTSPVSGLSTFTFNYHDVNSQNTASTQTTVTLTYLAPTGLVVSVQDAKDHTPIEDYRWIIEEDRTFQIDPNQVYTGSNGVQSLGTNFHTSHMPVVAAGCVGPISCEQGQTVLDINKFLADGTTANPNYLKHVAAVCDVGNGACRSDADQKPEVDPSQVALDPSKHYFISILPGDAADPFNSGAGGPVPVDPNNPDGAQRPFDLSQDCEPGVCGHGMGGAPISPAQIAAGAVTVNLELEPLQTAKIAVYVFEDDHPLNGENDAGGGVDTLATLEPGLGGFEITLNDQAGGFGDSTGQPTYDMFGMPLSNALAGTPDPLHPGNDACPITSQTDGLVGMIVTCPYYESDGVTPSPLVGQALIANLYPGLYEVVATPGADRIARGEEWLQTNSLDGTKGLEAFIKAGEPAYFQEFGPAGYHVSIGFANPQIINDRKAEVCAGAVGGCNNTISGQVTTARTSRSPDERIYSSGSYDANGFTQCYVSMGDPDEEDFAFTKCDENGQFKFTGIPTGNWRITVFDQWNDLLVDGLSTPVTVGGAGNTDVNIEIPMQQWRTNLSTQTFFDTNGNGVRDGDEAGLALVPVNVRFRDGSFSNFNNTDLAGAAGFNEIFPYFAWMVLEADTNRYKQTGVHVVYDVGGPVDTGGVAAGVASSAEVNHLPVNLRVPGALYCADSDCTSASHDLASPSSARIDPPSVTTEAWQGFIGNTEIVEFGKTPYAEGENGGIKGHVIYFSTRPFDDPALDLQLSWTPGVPNVTINLYQVGTSPDGTRSLRLVDHTTTTSWDDWAQGFRSDGIPNMNCPGQDGTSPFLFTLTGSTQWLDPLSRPLPGDDGTPGGSHAGRWKCYDGLHSYNQVQPAPYDGLYKFPSVTATDPTTGVSTATNCTICGANPANPQLPAGKYVVEMVLPQGYELVKEEDKNILLGDNYIAPVTQQFAGFGNIYILPDQAAVLSAYNPNNTLNSTNDLGATPRHEGDTGSVETFWPCVGQARVVPDFVSLFPGSQEVSPFAGATRNLCDRKEVTLEDQMQVLAKFYVFSSTHVASHFTGIITDDFSSEFDPFSPQFGEKFAVPNLPISFKDWNGTEIFRTYSDQWGFYNGMTYSTFAVNPPSPSGYVPQMMVACMNDPGPVPGPNGTMITDPKYNPNYSQFCYEWAYMPGQTAYMDTPVVPTSAFAEAYNPVDCAYPDATPAILRVDGDGTGPWVGVGAGSVASLALGNSGSGFTSAPVNFNITGGGGSGATGQITDLKLLSISSFACSSNPGSNNRCTNFLTNPAVTITGGGGGSGATATATKSGTTISFVVTNQGGGYTSRPTISVQRITNGSTTLGNTSAVMGANGVALTANGSGYAAGSFNVNISNGATATATVGTSSQILTITALGDQLVPNNAYSGPRASSTPFNQTSVTRHYGFGSNPPASGNGVTIGGVPATINSWSDNQIVVQVPGNVPNCTRQQRSAPPAKCGELVITAANGKQSVDAVTVTIGGSTPTVVGPGQSIQTAIDNARPGDLIIVSPGSYDEMLLMWKPVRLQGVGAASVIINANTHPAGRMDVWRRRVNCLFGLSLNGTFTSNSNPYDPTGAYSCSFVGAQVDPIPGEPLVGWDSNLNGNLAEFLQEPTLLGAYEGAGITVLGKGLLNPNTPGVCDALDAGGCIALTTAQCSNNLGSTNPNSRSNFLCNPSRVDGITFTNSSGGGGGIYVHGWNHYLDIGNNRVRSNIGTLTGGITVGQMETTDAIINGTQQQAFGYNTNISVHHNAITQNASIGDELNSTTPSAAGGITFCTGADSYRFNHNWVCGNLSTGDGGGAAHFGVSYDGNISNNWILFNQSFNPTVPTYGGGLLVAGAPPDGPVCENAAQDQDCPPALSDGIGQGLVIDSNLFLGNSAESGSGGGLRLQSVNGTDAQRNPTNSSQWYQVAVTNNIFADNVAGWDGGGVSLQDALRVNFTNNTVVANDTTASSGVLFNTLGAANGNVPPPSGSGNGSGCTPQPDPNAPQNPSCVNPVSTSTNQVAGFVTIRNTSNLIAAFQGQPVSCPSNYPNPRTGNSATCRSVSYPVLQNDIFWQNRPFHITTSPGAGLLSQQNVVTLVPTLSQAVTGACPATGVNGSPGPSYWDIGVRGDTGPTNHNSGFTLSPVNSLLTSFSTVYNANNNIAPGSPGFVQQYCNGSRVPPENGGLGYNVDPGIADATVPNPLFNLTPAATVDEGNNWVNMAYGPLSLTHPQTGATLGNYGLTNSSPAINTALASVAPNHDFFGTHRPQGNGFDIGAVEFIGTAGGGGGGGTPTRPTLTVLDNFNRGNNNTLNNGSNWSQLVVLSNAGIRVDSNQAFCINTGLAAALCLPGTAYWNNPTGGFGASQAAAFTFANTTVNGSSLILKATGTFNAANILDNFIRVRYSTSGGGQVIVETTTNSGGSYTTRGTLTGFGGFANGDTITALVDATGTVYVWKNANASPIGAGVVLPSGWTGSGRIGIQLPAGARVDNFAGGTTP